MQPVTEDEAAKILMVGALGVMKTLKEMGFGRHGVHAVATILLTMPIDGFQGDPRASAFTKAAVTKLAKEMVERFNKGEVEA